jgi:hypothetical protein
MYIIYTSVWNNLNLFFALHFGNIYISLTLHLDDIMKAMTKASLNLHLSNNWSQNAQVSHFYFRDSPWTSHWSSSLSIIIYRNAQWILDLSTHFKAWLTMTQLVSSRNLGWKICFQSFSCVYFARSWSLMSQLIGPVMTMFELLQWTQSCSLLHLRMKLTLYCTRFNH